MTRRSSAPRGVPAARRLALSSSSPRRASSAIREGHGLPRVRSPRRSPACRVLDGERDVAARARRSSAASADRGRPRALGARRPSESCCPSGAVAVVPGGVPRRSRSRSSATDHDAVRRRRARPPRRRSMRVAAGALQLHETTVTRAGCGAAGDVGLTATDVPRRVLIAEDETIIRLDLRGAARERTGSTCAARRATEPRRSSCRARSSPT